jgi:hypothetical protein
LKRACFSLTFTAVQAACLQVRMSRTHLSRVFLDNFRRTDMRLVWIFPELASGSALAQQIPALIELDLDFLQTLLFIARK